MNYSEKQAMMPVLERSAITLVVEEIKEVTNNLLQKLIFLDF